MVFGLAGAPDLLSHPGEMKASRLPLVLLATTILLTPPGFGLGIRVLDQNPEATARGNAFAATADNASAIYYNPAGITQLAGTNVLLGAYAVSISERVKLDEGDHRSFSNTNGEFQTVPQYFLTWKPENCPVTLGFGSYAPYGFALDFPDNAPFRTLSHKGKITFLTLNPVVAMEVTPGLSLAAGATINYAKAELNRGVRAEGDKFSFNGDDVAYGFNAGILWKPHPMHHFGLNYRSATDVEFSGHSQLEYDSFTVPTPFGPFEVPGVFDRQQAKARFHFPQNIVLGYAFTPTNDWNFEFNVDWTDWDSLNNVDLRQETGVVPLDFNWKSTFFYEFGVTKKFDHGLRVSAGYMYTENAVPSQSQSFASVPDSNRHVFSVGVGQTFTHVSWDLAYQYTHGPERQVAQNTSADGLYRFDSHAVTLSLGYHF